MMKNISKCFLAIIISVFMGMIFRVAPCSPLILLSAILVVYLCCKMDIKVMLCAYIMLYPLIPQHAGLDMGNFLPVFKWSRGLNLLLLLNWLRNKKSLAFRGTIQTFPLSKYFVFYLFWLLISSLQCFNIKGFVFAGFSFFLEQFMVGYIFYEVIRNQSESVIIRTYFFIALSVVLPVCLSFVTFITGFSVFQLIAPYRDVVGLAGMQFADARLGAFRAKGAFLHSIPFGVFCSLAISAVSTVFITKKSFPRHRQHSTIILAALYIICFIGSYMSGSRLAIALALANLAFILLFMHPLRALFLGCFSLFSVLCFLVFKGLKSNIIILLLSIFSLPGTNSVLYKSSFARIEQIESNLKIFYANPWFGSGGLSGIKQVGIIDNYYWAQILNFGVLTTVAHCLLYGATLFLAIRTSVSRNNSRFGRIVSFWTVLAIISVLITFFVLTLIDYVYLIWIYIGIFYGVRDRELKRNLTVATENLQT